MTTIAVDTEVREKIRALAEHWYEPVNVTLRKLLELEVSGPTNGQGKEKTDE